MLARGSIWLLLGVLLPIIIAPFDSAAEAALVKESLTFTWQNGAPNGQGREMILTNGQFPSPLLVFNEGDDVEITVKNDMHDNTTVHWHGIDQRESPWSDGVPGLSQTPIEPGETYVYRFKASPPGQHWYHSHSRATLLDGMYGPLLVKRKPGTPNPFHMISQDAQDIRSMERAAANPHVMVLSDWTKFNSTQYLEATAKSNVQIFCVDSILVNGKGSVFCPGHEWLNDMQMPYMFRDWRNHGVTDKGCFPFVPSIVGPWLPDADLSQIPYGMQEGCSPSSGPKEIIEIDPDQRWASINWVGASTLKTLQPTIDEHDMWIYEVDGHYIEPRKADAFLIWAGERYSAMIKLDKRKMDYTIRVADGGYSQMISAFGTLRYKGGATDLAEPDRFGVTSISQRRYSYNAWPIGDMTMLNKTDIPPFPPNAPARQGDVTHILLAGKANSTWEFTLGGKKKYPEDHSAYKPLLEYLDSAEAKDDDLIIRTKNGTWQDIILQVGHSKFWPAEFPHAIHKHANKYWQIGTGRGEFNYTSVNEAIQTQPELFNLDNPPYRDTFLNDFTGPMWIALRYQVTHPGAWLLHCHFETHLSNGMAMAILDGVDVWPSVPPEYANNGKGLCHAQDHGDDGEHLVAASGSVCLPATKSHTLFGFNLNKALRHQKTLIALVGLGTLILSLAVMGFCKGILPFGQSKQVGPESTLELEEINESQTGAGETTLSLAQKRKKDELRKEK